jgi:hypothetical protein
MIYLHFNEFKTINHDKQRITATNSDSNNINSKSTCNKIHDNLQASQNMHKIHN